MPQTVGILSIGEMGLGIAQVLQFHGYRVVTNVSDRSEATQDRAKAHNIDNVGTDVALAQECDYILSIVPPKKFLATAERIQNAANQMEGSKQLLFLDLNAVSPMSSKEEYKFFENSGNVILYDGVISGGVPYPLEHDGKGAVTKMHCPTLLMSGPNKITDTALVKAINIEHMSDKVGAAVAVKMCFGMVTKGYIALAIQSFTTAHRMGVLEELEQFLGKYKPHHLKAAQDGIVRMPHTAYRWVHEMLEMAETVSDYGGFDKGLFEGVAESYRIVAEDTVLGTELPDARVRGKTVLDAVTCIIGGIERKKMDNSR